MRFRTTSQVRLDAVADGRDNNFDVLRLVAATMVLVSHAFPLTGHDEPLAALGGPTLGGLGVALFFTMSGFLIAKSWSWQPSLRDFARKRFLRIMPGLWVAVALTVLVLGPLVTTVSLGAYFSTPGVWGYFARCWVLLTFDSSLPGVFSDNVYADAVNGSLWTLPLEVAAYSMVVLLGVAALFERRRVVGGMFVAAFAASTVVQVGVLAEPLALLAYFLVGTTAYLYRDRISLSWPWALLGLASWVLSFGTPALVPVSLVVLPYAVFVCAYRTPRALRHLCGAGDVSYGIYIYAFPVQQTAVLMGAETPLENFLVAAPITWLLACASWRIVEQPALRWKPKPQLEAGAPAATATRTVEPSLARTGGD